MRSCWRSCAGVDAGAVENWGLAIGQKESEKPKRGFDPDHFRDINRVFSFAPPLFLNVLFLFCFVFLFTKSNSSCFEFYAYSS